MVKLVLAFFDDLIVVDPDVALSGKHVNVRLGFPVGMGLASVGVSKRDVHAGKFFILQKNADHLGKSKIGAESELADTVAVFVGVAILPEFLLKVFAFAFHAKQASAL